MNSLIVLVLLCSAVVFAQQQQITSIQFSTVKSEYTLSEKSQYRLYTPMRAQVVKTIPPGSLSNGDYGNFVYQKQRKVISPIRIQQSAVELSGPHIILLEPYLIPTSSEKIGANVLFNQIDQTAPFIKIGLFDDYRKIEQLAQSTDGTDYGEYHLFRNALILPYRYSTEKTYAQEFFAKNSSKYRYGYSLLNLWEKFLKEENFSIYGKPFFVRTRDGNIYPAVIKTYGREQLMYAMYGVWTDEQKAKQFNFHKGDRIYFSAKSMVPIDGDTTCQAANEFQIPKAQRYGKKNFKYDEIMSDKRSIYPQLAWSPVPIHSDMADKKYDQVGTPFHNGIEVPTAPDDVNNTNGMGLQQCPDKDWYWTLFCDCANDIVKVTQKVYDATAFVDYSDYAHMDMMQKQYDPTLYGEDNSVSPLKATTENQPTGPLLFNKDCVLLNARVPELYDPFASNATFKIHYRSWDWKLSNLGWHAHGTDVSDKMKRCINDLRHVYNYFCNPGKHESNWKYQKINGKWQKKWQHNGDVEILIDKPEYADSAWYVANPFANYGPYEDFIAFAVYDNNTADNKGPFSLISYDAFLKVKDKRDVPEYRRYSISALAFSPENIQFNHPDNKKDWFVHFNYDLIYKDKWGRKVFVGNLKVTFPLWLGEDNHVMPVSYKLNDHVYNRNVTIGGSSLLNSQTAYYDKNSKSYRTDQTDVSERDPDEFDKGDAIREIARKIIVAEAFDYSMKTLHYVGTHQNNFVGYSAAGLYETSKRIENRIAQSFAYKLAKNTYEGFLLWRRTMDILKNLRDTYIKIGDAWDGLLYTVQGVADYYSNLDLKKIRLTNISDLFPRNVLIELDYRVFSMQKSFTDFTAAVHAMALVTDSLTGGNYGPLNPAIRATYAALQSSVLQTGANTTNLLDNTNSELQNLKNKTKGTSSDQQYLSNITRSTYNIISNQRLKVMNNGARNVALALYLTESESKQWIAHSRYLKAVATEVPQRFNEAIKNVNSDTWAALAWSLQPPSGLFDQATSDYLLQLSEKKNAK
ncbi:MAG: hypothetical protein JXK07_13325 [Spirochaetes bacterium]|nr:hypothetical protein [Spirochaetota bacterium]